jgi:hypothetical protein
MVTDGSIRRAIQPVCLRLPLSHQAGTIDGNPDYCTRRNPLRGLTGADLPRGCQPILSPSFGATRMMKRISPAERSLSQRRNNLLSSTYLSQGAARPNRSVPLGRAAPPLNRLLSPRIVVIQGSAGPARIMDRS